MKVSRAQYFRKSQPLSEMEAILPGKKDRTWKDSLVKNFTREDFFKTSFEPSPAMIDPVRQAFPGSLVNTGPLQTIEGVGNVNSVYPPDTDGDVGPNHYFQMINLSFAIWDKEGNKLYGPVNNSTLWSGFAGPWVGTNDGDPIILYDHAADRWFASQFAVNTSNGTYWELIAISVTGDPLGSWYQYAFQFPAFNDYPKVGIWPDAYYASFNMFGSYNRVAAAAWDRNAMIAGNPNAQMVLFDLPQNAGPWSMLPADWDGPTPPTGTPNYFAYVKDGGSSGNDYMHFWEFKVNWTNVALSTFAQAFSLQVEPFDSYFCSAPRHACIPQPNSTQGLETLSDRLMFRLNYRNFGTHQSMVTCHSVDADGNAHAGVRWYEFRKTGTSPWSIYQQGTYAPDITNRWMPSVAINSKGVIAIGYSVSSETVFPSIRYAGRTANAPLGTMNLQEVEAVTGTNSQGNYARWGDYAKMSVDPVDDSTFWFTTEYNKGGWKTKIIEFDFSAVAGPDAFAGPDTNMCNLIPYLVGGASASNSRLLQWTSTGDGYFSRPNDINPIYFYGSNDKTNGQVKLILTAQGYIVGDSDSDTMLLTLSPSPIVHAGPDTLICKDGIAELHGSATNYTSSIWTTKGDGTFSLPDSLVTNYFPGSSDILKGYARLTLTAEAIEPCPQPMADEMRVNIDQCTAIEDQVLIPELKIYPNPSDGVFYLSVKETGGTPFRISVSDANGQVIFTKYYPNPAASITNSLNLSYLPKGTYFIKIESRNTERSQKIILN
jgi:hypothetical protein